MTKKFVSLKNDLYSPKKPRQARVNGLKKEEGADRTCITHQITKVLKLRQKITTGHNGIYIAKEKYQYN